MPRRNRPPHRSTLSLPAVHRLAIAAGALVLLWLAVLWSVPEPLAAFSLDLSGLFPLVVSLLLLVLAEGFRVGSRLRDDVEGLV